MSCPLTRSSLASLNTQCGSLWRQLNYTIEGLGILYPTDALSLTTAQLHHWRTVNPVPNRGTLQLQIRRQNRIWCETNNYLGDKMFSLKVNNWCQRPRDTKMLFASIWKSFWCQRPKLVPEVPSAAFDPHNRISRGHFWGTLPVRNTF